MYSNINKKKKKNKKVKKNINKSIFIILILLLIITSITIKNSNASTTNVEDFIKSNNLEVVEVGVRKGNTFWTIQKKYLPENIDIREAMFWAEKINDVDIGSLKPFDTIKIFKGKDF